ncbi:L-2-hydroxyglutarate oxidase [Cryobacterium melibiosiphilum]|uniref:L-2-hydroxyglutarate oxidase n=1 Tax=Cryobacterium melibiosiphilum TaxID=995039 RepID=A0A3A5MHG1_9MICO|nr:L-2-hydroxyglutarate oxidase [Cryobacterium melibiosiphilum]RJT89577.1 L-2-hydroxyglutarate oxidase [Cryobacterium melibiosiphilum]
MALTRVVIIGGGIVGLAVAERLSRRGAHVTVIEKEQRWAAHQTGHNSGVIHAGPYYKPGSLKATLCTAGNTSMFRFAEENGIAHVRSGKLIVAVDNREIPRLRALADRAQANGIAARLVSGSEAREFEPHVAAVEALRVESTGIIDYTAVSTTLARLAEAQGAEMLLGTAARDIRVTDRSVTVVHDSGSVTADLLINCAGLQSDRIAQLAGLRPEARIVPFRGEYYELTADRRDLVRGLIYPVPDPDLPFLGVHFTRMIDGSVHAGPNAVLALAREGYSWGQINVRDTLDAVTYPGFLKLAGKNVVTGGQEIARSLSKRLFAASLARLVPELTGADIVRAGAGVRAQAILPDGSLADDFLIQTAPRQVHVLNAPSPAATSALEIARHIVAQADLGLDAPRTLP